MLYRKCSCDLCRFENPKISTAGIIVEDQKILVAKRAIEPFKGQWDFLGGFIEKDETPEEGHKREIKEELGIDCEATLLGVFPGKAFYKDFEFPVLGHAFLTELRGNIKLNKKENSELAWVPISELRSIAFDSNQKILRFVKEKLSIDLQKVRDLVTQLDSTAKLNEQSLYKAMTDGYVSKIEKGRKLLGMGWIFPRQTMLRRQAVVEDMIVDESQRGKGLGEEILRDLIKWAKSQGVEVIELTTNPKRIAANSLYSKVGFRLHETNHYLLDLKRES